MASAWGSAWGNAWGSAWGVVGATPAVPQPNLPGGGSQGAFRNVRSVRRTQRERNRREEEEVMAILQAVMPLIDAQTDAQHTIILGDRNGKLDS